MPYRKPKIVGCVSKLPEIIKKKKCDHVLIITDAGIRSLGLLERLEEALKKAEIPYEIYDKTVANPTTANDTGTWGEKSLYPMPHPLALYIFTGDKKAARKVMP